MRVQCDLSMGRTRLSAIACNDQYRVLGVYLRNMLELIGGDKPNLLLDLGCGPASYTLAAGEQSGAVSMVGVDIDNEALRTARGKGVDTVKADLNDRLPFPDKTFDLVISSQVIEHLLECDLFADEIHRILKPGGHAIIATENLAGWHNVLSLVLGFQPLTENVSAMKRIGNPFASNYGEVPRFDNLHTRVFTLFSLNEFLELHRLHPIAVKCSGYPPFPYPLSSLFCRLDPRHSRYIIIKVARTGD